MGTKWDGGDIWLRREVDLPKGHLSNLMGWLHHDEDAEIYLNGVSAYRTRGYSTDYETVDLTSRASAALKPGSNLIAIHCHQTTGGQYLDFGLAESRVWIDGVLASQRPDGDFGPDERFKDDGTRDYWANMIMLFASGRTTSIPQTRASSI